MTEEDKYLLYWQETAHDALDTAKGLFKLKHFDYSLFFCHLALERLIKGLVYKKTKKPPFPIHNLVKLAHDARLKLTQESLDELSEITTWNIRARYDNIKRDFYKKATTEFTKAWFIKVNKIYLWLKNQY